MNEDILSIAIKAASEIEAAATCCSYSACQGAYGVGVEALLVGGEDWVKDCDLEDGSEIQTVRFFDCDGNRSDECTTAREVEEQRDIWIDMVSTTAE